MALIPLAPPAERGHNAFQSVPRRCPGCELEFIPLRKNQRHCRPGCRRLALERRRALPLLDSAADALRTDGSFE
jgi:hypothetical protein